jgi:hypothetical protein
VAQCKILKIGDKSSAAVGADMEVLLKVALGSPAIIFDWACPFTVRRIYGAILVGSDV